MKNIKHTPGPWKIKEQTQKLPGNEVVTDYHIFHDHEFICTSWPPESVMLALEAEPDDWQAIAKANAKLIASAPELLEALRFCQSVIKSQGIFDVSERMAFDKAEEAIKKATES